MVNRRFKKLQSVSLLDVYHSGAPTDESYRGEQAASALESKLDGIHRNLDQLLASFEEMEQTRNKPSGVSDPK